MKLACLFLAAGGSSRFGGRKQLARIDGQAMITKTLGEVTSVFAEHTYVITGAYHDDVRQCLPLDGQVLHHENWADGIGSTIAFGMKAVASYDAVMITLADQVGLRAQDFARMVEAFDGKHIVSAFYEGRNGAPALFPSAYFDALACLRGDKGAQGLLKTHKSQVRSLDLARAAYDIDTKQDLIEYGKKRYDAA